MKHYLNDYTYGAVVVESYEEDTMTVYYVNELFFGKCMFYSILLPKTYPIANIYRGPWVGTIFLMTIIRLHFSFCIMISVPGPSMVLLNQT